MGSFAPEPYVPEPSDEEIETVLNNCMGLGLASMKAFPLDQAKAAKAARAITKGAAKVLSVKVEDVKYALADVTRPDGSKLLVTVADIAGVAVPIRGINPVTKILFIPTQVWLPAKETVDTPYAPVLAISFGTEPPPGSKVLEAIPVD